MPEKVLNSLVSGVFFGGFQFAFFCRTFGKLTFNLFFFYVFCSRFPFIIIPQMVVVHAIISWQYFFGLPFWLFLFEALRSPHRYGMDVRFNRPSDCRMEVFVCTTTNGCDSKINNLKVQRFLSFPVSRLRLTLFVPFGGTNLARQYFSYFYTASVVGRTVRPSPRCIGFHYIRFVLVQFSSVCFDFVLR